MVDGGATSLEPASQAGDGSSSRRSSYRQQRRAGPANLIRRAARAALTRCTRASRVAYAGTSNPCRRWGSPPSGTIRRFALVSFSVRPHAQAGHVRTPPYAAMEA